METSNISNLYNVLVFTTLCDTKFRKITARRAEGPVAEGIEPLNCNNVQKHELNSYYNTTTQQPLTWELTWEWELES
jgi:hypothetical protein